MRCFEGGDEPWVKIEGEEGCLVSLSVSYLVKNG